MCDIDVMSQEELITYESIVQGATQEYRNFVNLKRWELATRKEKSKFQPSLPRAYIVVIDQSINNPLN